MCVCVFFLLEKNKLERKFSNANANVLNENMKITWNQSHMSKAPSTENTNIENKQAAKPTTSF